MGLSRVPESMPQRLLTRTPADPHRPGQLMTEHLIQLRYTLRLRVLHHAAFQRVGRYDPAAVMAKLTKRLFEKYAGDLMKDRGSTPVERVRVGRSHIEFLNRVGASIVAQHETYVGASTINPTCENMHD